VTKVFTINDLASYWGIDSLEVVGQFIPASEQNKRSLFVNLMGFNAKGKGFVLLHPTTLRRLTVVAESQTIKLESYKYYRFSLRDSTGKDLVTLDRTKPIEYLEKNPYQEIVRNQFYEYSAPKSDITVANL
jgi:hypothetical protein